MFVLVIRQREVGVPLIPFNALTGHRPALQRLPRAWHQTRAEHGAGSGRLSGGCDLPSTGNWDSGNPAFALSRGSHDGPPSTPSRCPSLTWHAVVPFTFRIQVSQQTQEPPSEFLPAEPGIQPGASWRTASGRRPAPRRAARGGPPRHRRPSRRGTRSARRVVAQPGLDDVSCAARQDVDALAGQGIDEDGGVAAAAAQRQVVHAQHPRHRHRGQGNPEQDAQRGMPRDRDIQRCQHPRSGPVG